MGTQGRCPQRCRGLSLVVLGLVLGVWLCPVSAQDTPVTVDVVFGDGDDARPPLGGGGCIQRSSLCHAPRTSFDVFSELVLPRLDTRIERALAQVGRDVKQWYEPHIFSAVFRYERVDFDLNSTVDLDGDIYATLLNGVWEFGNFSYGALIPVEFLDAESLDAYRVGLVLYGQYHHQLAPPLTVGVTINANYRHTGIDDDRFDDLNAFGTGVALSLEYDRELYRAGLAFLYNYSHDDSDFPDDEQHLMSIGTSVGTRVGKRAAVNVFAIWNRDLTDEQDTTGDTDEDYFDLGIDLSWSFTPTWKLIGGYKKVLDLDDFDSDMGFVGTLLRF